MNTISKKIANKYPCEDFEALYFKLVSKYVTVQAMFYKQVTTVEESSAIEKEL